MIFTKTVILKILEIFQNTGKIQVFSRHEKFLKTKFGENTKNTDTFFLQFSLKGAAHSVSLGLRQLLLRRAVLGGGLPPEIAADINQSTRSSHSRPLRISSNYYSSARGCYAPIGSRLRTSHLLSVVCVCRRMCLNSVCAECMFLGEIYIFCARAINRHMGKTMLTTVPVFAEHGQPA